MQYYSHLFCNTHKILPLPTPLSLFLLSLQFSSISTPKSQSASLKPSHPKIQSSFPISPFSSKTPSHLSLFPFHIEISDLREKLKTKENKIKELEKTLKSEKQDKVRNLYDGYRKKELNGLGRRLKTLSSIRKNIRRCGIILMTRDSSWRRRERILIWTRRDWLRRIMRFVRRERDLRLWLGRWDRG